MKTVRIAIFVVVALAQLSVPALMAWGRMQTLSRGRVWKFKTAPIDPEDVVRGRYIALRFAAEDFTQPEKFESTGSVYAVLKETPDGFAEIDHTSATPISGDNVIKVEPGGNWDGRQHIVIPFTQFWITEKSAPEADKAYRENSRRGKENAYVTVRVRSGDAALEQLYIDNQPLADYLRAQAAKK
jgi:uncharacterized membrane-anchored protein